jgi:N-acetylglucosaminyldiphosphoundecaprenol N-acetyl-beta-D-mannosaminyltransferase
MPEALDQIEGFIAKGGPHHVFTADASGLIRAYDDPNLLAIVRRADLVTPDGAGTMLSARMRGITLPERVSGCDLVQRLAERAARNGHRLYLLGAAPGVADAAATKLVQRFPDLVVAGVRDGYFAPAQEPGVVRAIAEARPDILFVALGIPKQEQFIDAHRDTLGAPVLIGVGGSFDVIAGNLRRAPRWMQRLALEWLFRAAQEPKRLGRLTALPRFLWTAWRTRRAG